MADINTWNYCSFSQPHPCFLPMVWSRGVSAVVGFEEEEEEGRTNPQVSCSLVTLTSYVFPAMYNRLSSHSYPSLFHSLFYNVWLYFKSQDLILAPDWYPRNDHCICITFRVTLNLRTAKMLLTSQIITQYISLQEQFQKMCFGKL